MMIDSLGAAGHTSVPRRPARRGTRWGRRATKLVDMRSRYLSFVARLSPLALIGAWLMMSDGSQFLLADGPRFS